MKGPLWMYFTKIYSGRLINLQIICDVLKVYLTSKICIFEDCSLQSN